MRKVVVGLGILAVLAVAGLLTAPYLINLEGLKSEIAAQVYDRTGRALGIAGPLQLTFLPAPAITARDVRLANPPNAASPDMLKLRRLEVKLAFWPLLSGRVEVRSATLVEPELDLERLPEGRSNWQFGAPQPSSSGSGAAETIAPTAMRLPAFPIDRLGIDHLVIQNGSITYRGGDAVERLEHIGATLGLDSLDGPFHVDGNLVTRGASVKISASAGRLDDGGTPLHLVLETRPSARLEFDGVLVEQGGGRRVSGKLKLAADDLAAAAPVLLRAPLPAVFAQRALLTAEVAGSVRSLALDHLALDIGPAHAEGALHVAGGQPVTTELALRLNRLNLDRWFAAAEGAGSRPSGTPPSAGAATAEAAAPLPAVIMPSAALLALPGGIKAQLDLAVEAVLWRGDVIREARLTAALDDGRLSIEKLATLLPGGAEIDMSGAGANVAGVPHFDGSLHADADDLRALLGWLGVDVAAVPGDRLRKASWSSRLALAGDHLDIADVEAAVDTTRLRGAATVALGQRLGIGLRVVADRVNLDAYAWDGAALPLAAVGSSGVGNVLGAFDANFDARVDALTLRGQPLRDLHVSGTVQNGGLAIHELGIADLAGATAKVSGNIDALDAGLPKAQLAFDLRGPELDAVLRLVAPDIAAGRSFGAFTLGGGLQTTDGDIALDTDLQMLGGRAHVAGDLAPQTGAVNATLEVDHPSFDGLLQSFLPSYRPSGGALGALKLAGHVKGGGAHYDIDRLSLAIGTSTLEGAFGVALGGARPGITAEVTLGDWAIDRLFPARETAWGRPDAPRGPRPGLMLAAAGDQLPAASTAAPWSRAALDLGMLRLVDADVTLAAHSLAYGKWRLDQPALAATLKDGTIEIGRLAGGLFGGSLAATGKLAAGGPPALQGRVVLHDVDLGEMLADSLGIGAIAGRVDVDAALESSGASPLDLVSHLAGQANLVGRDGRLSGIDLKGVSDALKASGRPAGLLDLIKSGAGGSTPFSRLDGTFRMMDGVARSDDLRLETESGEGHAEAVLDLPQWTIQSRTEFHFAAVADAPPLVIHVDGSLGDPWERAEVNALSQYLNRRLQDKPAPGPQPPAGNQPSAQALRDFLKSLHSDQ